MIFILIFSEKCIPVLLNNKVHAIYQVDASLLIYKRIHKKHLHFHKYPLLAKLLVKSFKHIKFILQQFVKSKIKMKYFFLISVFLIHFYQIFGSLNHVSNKEYLLIKMIDFITKYEEFIFNCIYVS